MVSQNIPCDQLINEEKAQTQFRIGSAWCTSASQKWTAPCYSPTWMVLKDCGEWNSFQETEHQAVYVIVHFGLNYGSTLTHMQWIMDDWITEALKDTSVLHECHPKTNHGCGGSH